MVSASDSLNNIATLRNHRNARVSSYDTTGGNADFWVFNPGERRIIADVKGPGIIRHIWMTLMCAQDAYLRRIVLRMFWDDEDEPSVETPIGDFFGLGHAATTYFASLPLSMFDRGFNCYFPMPFYRNAIIDVQHEGSEGPLILYFYIDYEIHDKLPVRIP